MNKLVRSLLSGASLATLQLCAIGGAARATTINGPRGAYTNPAGVTTGSILVTGTGDITGDLTNEGTVGPDLYYGIEVNGTISGTLNNAATGVINATGVGITVSNIASIGGGINNAGKILVGTSLTSGNNAHASGIFYGSTTGAKIANSGAVSVNAAVATMSSSQAHATVKGIAEYGDDAYGAGVTHTLTNSGAVSLTAAAKATYSHVSSVEAYAESGLKQNAHNGAALIATLTNDGGAISLKATANAKGTSGGASARAEADGAIRQTGVNSSGHRGDSISLTITNSGDIALSADAAAFGPYEGIRANATVESAIYQYADNAGSIVESLTNSGAIHATANAKAVGSYASASLRAKALVRSLIGQTAEAGSAPAQSIAQTITNSGDLTISGTALAQRGGAASCCRENVANATAKLLINQSASNAETITQAITNSGTIGIELKATASGKQYHTDAHAEAKKLFNQLVEGVNTASLSITNSAAITIGLTASVAGREQIHAGASALKLFHQHAVDAGTVTETIANSGAITIGASASLKGTSEYNTARASAENLFKQYADDVNAVTQSITNSGTIGIELKATASGGRYDTNAYAEARELFGQEAEYVNTASLSIANSAAINIGLTASAAGNEYNHAHASAEKLFAQSAANAGAVTEAITNSGAIGLVLKAKSLGTDYNTSAKANVDSIFDQHAQNANTAALSVQNSGAITIGETALAKGPDDVYAYAYADTLFNQSLSNVTTGTETIVNSGNLRIAAAATAVGVNNGSDRVRASATAESAFRQYATGKNLTQSITNSGSIGVSLTAKVKGVSDLEATARWAGDNQRLEGFGTVDQTLTNTGALAVTLNASGTGAGVDAYAEADTALYQRASYNTFNAALTGPNTSSAAMAISNSGTISVDANATAKSLNRGQAEAYFDNFFRQYAEDGFNTVSETITNTKALSAQIVAKASGTGVRASETGGGFSQDVSRAPAATLSVVNSGDLSIKGTANALGTQWAYASGQGYGVRQQVELSGTTGLTPSVSLSVNNSGTIEIASVANAHFAFNDGYASASGQGIEQSIRNIAGATAAITNSATIDVSAAAAILRATPGLGASAPTTTVRLPFVQADAVGLSVQATGKNYVYQNHDNYGAGNNYTSTVHSPTSTTLKISNSGTINVAATANGSSFQAANITALANGIAAYARSQTAKSYTRTYVSNDNKTAHWHTAYTGGTLNGAISNTGTVSVSASAPDGKATANGILVSAGDNDVAVTNQKGGTISVQATGAIALAAGIHENGIFHIRDQAYTHQGGSNSKVHVTTSGTTPSAKVSGNITNSGTINVSATQSGEYIGNNDGGGMAPASVPATPALGIRADGIAVNALDVTGNILNAGTINVTAQGAAALANGIHVFASQTATRFNKTYARHFVSSVSQFQTAKSNGASVLHTALGGNTISGNITNTGTLNISATGAGAVAKGIDIEADTLDSAVVNSGAVNVTATGAGAIAEGIVIDANTLGTGASFQNNDGTISATQNGKRGTAIDVSNAPSTLALGLNGGSIYGNIVENAAGNAITVGSGNLLLNGLINPSKAKLGSLTVGANGTLTLANNAAEGDAAAYVHSFVQNGTLAIVGSTDGSSGSIHAANATLSGNAVVDVNLSGAPYGSSTTYKVVFSDAAISGTWGSVAASTGTTFFSASGVYTANEADITLTRASFNSIPGLTDNEAAVGGAIETIYDTSGGTGALGKLFGALLNLTPQQYADALESLSGIPAGELSATDQSSLQSLLDLINSHLGSTGGGGDGGTASLMSPSPVMASNGAPSNVSPAQMSSMSGTHVWGGGFQSSNSVDRTASGPAYSSHQSGLLAGIDVPVSQNVLLGVAASWATGDIKTEKMLGFGTFNSGQFAGYGRFTADNGLYGIGSVSYGDFTNKLDRFISIPGFGSGNVHGKFDSKVWGLYGEAGWKLDPSGWGGSVTPYAALSYLDAKSDGYTETGFGAPLVIGGSSSKATSSYLGVKLANTWEIGTGTITPRLTAAWQHDFTKNAWEMSAAFAAAPTVGFGLNGSDLSRDGAYIDGGITLGIADSVDVLLDYQGRFTSDRTDNAFMARANFKF